MEVCNVPEFAGPARPAGERQHQQQRPLLRLLQKLLRAAVLMNCN